MSYPTSVLVPEIRHRSAWTDVDAVGPLESEEVRFLIVHHTASSTQHEQEDVRGLLGGIRSFHVEGRGWNDIAYNFMIDRYGVVWEGRAGSLDGPVAGDATGGNQGFTQLVCLIGDFTAEPPSEPAQQSLIAMLAWLADRYEIDVQSGMTISFVSRGSNRWPEGTQVTTAPIAGHRDMSLTSCPGDAFYPMLAEVITPGVNQLSTPTTSTTVAPTTSSQVSATSTTSTSTSSKSTPWAIPTTTVLASGPAETDPPLIGLSVAAVAGGLLAGLIAWRMRRIGRR